LLAAESPSARAFPVRQGLISLSTGIGSFKYMPATRTLQGSARNLPYSKSLIFRQGNKGLPAAGRSQPWPRPGIIIGTIPVFSTGKIRHDGAGLDRDTGETRTRDGVAARQDKAVSSHGRRPRKMRRYRVRSSAPTARFRLSKIAAWCWSTASCVSVPSSSRKRRERVTLFVPGATPLPR
jgi:hypothetical protein